MAFISSQGSKLQVTIASTLTDIPQLQGFKPPGIETDFKELNTLDAPSNFSSYVQLMNKTSTATGKVYWDPGNTVHDFLMDEALTATKTLIAWKAIWPDVGAANMAFNGYLMKFGPDTQQNSVLEADFEIRSTGAPVYTQ